MKTIRTIALLATVVVAVFVLSGCPGLFGPQDPGSGPEVSASEFFSTIPVFSLRLPDGVDSVPTEPAQSRAIGDVVEGNLFGSDGGKGPGWNELQDQVFLPPWVEAYYVILRDLAAASDLPIDEVIEVGIIPVPEVRGEPVWDLLEANYGSLIVREFGAGYEVYWRAEVTDTPHMNANYPEAAFTSAIRITLEPSPNGEIVTQIWGNVAFVYGPGDSESAVFYGSRDSDGLGALVADFDWDYGGDSGSSWVLTEAYSVPSGTRVIFRRPEGERLVSHGGSVGGAISAVEPSTAWIDGAFVEYYDQSGALLVATEQTDHHANSFLPPDYGTGWLDVEPYLGMASPPRYLVVVDGSPDRISIDYGATFADLTGWNPGDNFYVSSDSAVNDGDVIYKSTHADEFTPAGTYLYSATPVEESNILGRTAASVTEYGTAGVSLASGYDTGWFAKMRIRSEESRLVRYHHNGTSRTIEWTQNDYYITQDPDSVTFDPSADLWIPGVFWWPQWIRQPDTGFLDQVLTGTIRGPLPDWLSFNGQATVDALAAEINDAWTNDFPLATASKYASELTGVADDDPKLPPL